MPAPREEYREAGINDNHAFSILAAHSSRAAGDRFLLVRDPHSSSRYQERQLTREILEILKKVNPARRSSGAFWIVWSTFLRFFSSITISMYRSDRYDVRLVNKFTEKPSEWLTSYSFTLNQSVSIPKKNIDLYNN